jgi:Flp pilus assembly protein TadD
MLLAIGIALITLFVHSHAFWNGFVDWDDQVNFLTNEHYRGLGLTHLRWMMTTVLMGQWIPLTWLTLGVDFAVWGMKPLGYHLTSVVLHSLAAAVFFTIAERIFRAGMRKAPLRTVRLGAAAAAVFFAIHPLRAESVAWVTERRDVLSGLMFFVTIACYLVAHERPKVRSRWLALSVAAYALACLSKSIVVTVPAVLLLLDVYPFRRLEASPARWWRSDNRHVLLEKAPFVLLALGTSVMAVYAQIANRFLTSLETLPLAARVPVVVYGVWFYISKTMLPAGLSPLYELPARVNPLEPRFLIAALGVVVLTTVFVVLRRRWPAGLAAWIAYLVILAPVSGLVHNGHQLAHDRYSYLPCLPWALLFGAAVIGLVTAGSRDAVRPAVAYTATCVAMLWLVGLATMTWHQIGVWRDNDTLWRYALEADSQCAICHVNLGVSLYNRRMPAQAIERFERALALRPDRVRTEVNVGLALMAMERPAEAIPRLERVIEKYPTDADVEVNLAVALLQNERHADAVARLRNVLRRDPNHVLALTNLGAALLAKGDPVGALACLERAVAIKPDLPPVHAGLIRTHLALGNVEAASKHLQILHTLDARGSRALEPLLVTVW